jgi:FkbM family methyltransferase
MINYIKNKLERHKLKRTFKEYGFRIDSFDVEGIGKVDYAQWLHPFEVPKEITKSNVQFYERLSKKGGMIIDIGAHAGDTTVPMALAVGKEGVVLGLEPNKYVYKILEENARLNQDFTHIIPLCFAATDEDGTFKFQYSDASFCNGGFLDSIENTTHRHNFELDVEGKNLERYLLENHKDDLPKLNLIKVDAEGYDKEILKTIPNIIKDYKPNLMIECYKRLNHDERNELFDVVEGYAYDLFYLENFEVDGEQIKIEREDMFKQKHFEMLAMPKN